MNGQQRFHICWRLKTTAAKWRTNTRRVLGFFNFHTQASVFLCSFHVSGCFYGPFEQTAFGSGGNFHYNPEEVMFVLRVPRSLFSSQHPQTPHQDRAEAASRGLAGPRFVWSLFIQPDSCRQSCVLKNPSHLNTNKQSFENIFPGRKTLLSPYLVFFLF